MCSLRFIDEKRGFPLDLQPANKDLIAEEAAKHIFGVDVVDKILDKWHRARISFDALQNDVMKYNVVHPPRPKDPVYQVILESVCNDFVSDELLIPWTLGRVKKNYSTPNEKSLGLPWTYMENADGTAEYVTKRDVLEDVKADGLIRKQWALVGKNYKVRLPDAMVYVRTEICSVDANEIRGAWDYPFSVILEEERFIRTYLDWICQTERDVPAAYGVEMTAGGMSYINDAWMNSPVGSCCLMLDWRDFDKHVTPWVLRDAFQILSRCFDFSKIYDSTGKAWSTQPINNFRRWKKIVKYFIETPFILPNGKRCIKDGGIPSGSTFRNLIGTIVNAIMTRYCIYRTTGRFPYHDIYMGDDGLAIVEERVNLDGIAEVALRVFGAVINEAKSTVTTNQKDIQFLGFYNNGGFPIRDQDFLIALFILPEHFHGEDDPLFAATRAVGLMFSTLNDVAAAKWLDLLRYMESKYAFEDNWFEKYRENHPTALEFLRLIGYDPEKLHISREDGHFVMPDVTPPPRPAHRVAKPGRHTIWSLVATVSVTTVKRKSDLVNSLMIGYLEVCIRPRLDECWTQPHLKKKVIKQHL